MGEDDAERFGWRLVVVRKPTTSRASIDASDERQVGFGFVWEGHDGEIAESDGRAGRSDRFVRALRLFSLWNFGGLIVPQFLSVDLSGTRKGSAEYCTHELAPLLRN